MSPIRAVIVISNLEFGGAQRQVVELASAMDPARCDLHVCSLSEYVPLAEGWNGRDHLHIIRKRFKYDLSVPVRLARLLARLKADIVHGYLFDAEIAARLAGRWAGTPVVIGSERNTDYALKRRQLITYRLTRNCMDFVIANSHAGAEFNSRTLGISPARYRVVHNGVNISRFRPAPGEDVRREIGLGPREPVVGMFGSFKAQKNHPMFFAAARRVLKDVPDARFLLVGDELYKGMHGSDDYKRKMDLMVDELGIRPRCLFLGNREDVDRLYTACDVVVLPSLFEGTPNVLLEAMACGVPVVASAVSDNATLVPEGQAGFLVRLGDEDALAERIVRLLHDGPLRRRMGAAARSWVEQEFSAARLAAKTLAVYQETLDAKLSGNLAEPRTSAVGA